MGLPLKHLLDPLTSSGKQGAHRHDWYLLSGANETWKRNIEFPMKSPVSETERASLLAILE